MTTLKVPSYPKTMLFIALAVLCYLVALALTARCIWLMWINRPHDSSHLPDLPFLIPIVAVALLVALAFRFLGKFFMRQANKYDSAKQS